MMIWIVVFWLLALFSPSLAEAACGGSSPNLTAASAAYSDVNDCVTAAIDGDTITVPSGSVTWSSVLQISNKSITLDGAGAGVTVIDAQAASMVGNGCAIQWTTKATGNTPAGLSRITGFTFQSSSGCPVNGSRSALVKISGVSHKFRFDHNEIVMKSAYSGLSTTEDVRGVVDHNEFLYPSATANGVAHFSVCDHTAWDGVGAYGDKSWAADSTWGSEDAMVFEDNNYDNQKTGADGSGYYAVDDSTGCRFVYRFNTLHNVQLSTHGTETNGRPRGWRHGEYYRNDWTWDHSDNLPVFGLRGASFRVFDNDVTNVSGASLTGLVSFNTYRHSHNVYGFAMGYCSIENVTSLTRSGTTATGHTSGVPLGYASGGTWVRIAGANDNNFNTTGVRAFGSVAKTITSSSVANPTVITTSTAHGFVTGDKVHISSHAGSTPSLNTACCDLTTGYHQITVTGSNTFTIPVNVTVGGTGGTVTNDSMFTYTVADTGATTDTGSPTVAAMVDGNTDAEGYRCIDQVGAGKSVLYSGEDATFSPLQAAGNELEPAYILNNKKNGTKMDGSPASGDTSLIVNDRDYYNQVSSFNGTTGIGRGARASRPATCTAGTAYWSTDGGSNWNTSTTETHSDTPGEDGALDVCTATNTWTNDYYVPSTYPHSLVSGAEPPPPSSNPPRFAPSINLRRADAGELAMVGE